VASFSGYMKVGGGDRLKDMILGAKSTGTVFVNVGWLKAIRHTAAYQGMGSPGWRCRQKVRQRHPDLNAVRREFNRQVHQKTVNY